MKKILLTLFFVAVIMTLFVNNSMALIFTDGFEGSSIDPFWDPAGQGTNHDGGVTLSNLQAHSGSQALDLFSIGFGGFGHSNVTLIHQFDQVMEGDYSVWFFDPGHAGFYGHIHVQDPVNGYSSAIGVQDWDPTFYHAGASGTPSNNEGQTTLQRSPGWHEFKSTVDTNGTNQYIDNLLVYSDTFENGFTNIFFNINTNSPQHIFFDDFNVNANPKVPEPSSMLLLGMGLVGLARRAGRLMPKV